jgi:hypothetical protein
MAVLVEFAERIERDWRLRLAARPQALRVGGLKRFLHDFR